MINIRISNQFLSPTTRQWTYVYMWHCPCGESSIIHARLWLTPPAFWHRCMLSTDTFGVTTPTPGMTTFRWTNPNTM